MKKTKNCLYSPGIWLEYILGGNFSRKFYVEGIAQNVKSKFRADDNFYNLNRFQYGVCGNFTYKFISVSTMYSFVQLFNNNSNVSVNKFETSIYFDIFGKDILI